MKGKEVIVYKLTLFQAMQFALNGSIFDDEVSFPTVNNATQLKNYVAYVFPEGTTSNGKSVLPLALTQDFLDQFLDTESSTSSSARKPSNLNVHTSQQLQTIHLKVNATLTTPLPIGKWKYLTRMSSQGVTFKCKINEPVLARIEELRTAMCGGDKYNLVGKNLTVESKQKFIKEFGTRRR